MQILLLRQLIWEVEILLSKRLGFAGMGKAAFADVIGRRGYGQGSSLPIHQASNLARISAVSAQEPVTTQLPEIPSLYPTKGIRLLPAGQYPVASYRLLQG